MRASAIRILVQVTSLMIITAFGEQQKLNKIIPVPDLLQNRFGFLKNVMNSEPSLVLQPQHYTSFLRPEEIPGDEMKSIMFPDFNKPNSGNIVNEYPDRTPESLPPSNLPGQFSTHSASTVFQLLKGQLSKSIPSIKAYLLTKDLQFPKLNQLTIPLKLDMSQTHQAIHQKHKHPIWSYLKPKSLTHLKDAGIDHQSHPESVIDQQKQIYYLQKGVPLESQMKDEPITLYLNKYSNPESQESIKISSESEHSDQPIYKETFSFSSKPTDNLDAIQSQFNEQHVKPNSQIALVQMNSNDYSNNSPASQALSDFYASPYLQNPHIIVTRPYTTTWVPNAKKWHPGTHKSAFYPDTRIIKFTINDRIYNNSTKRPNYATRTTVKSTTIKPPTIETEEKSSKPVEN